MQTINRRIRGVVPREAATIATGQAKIFAVARGASPAAIAGSTKAKPREALPAKTVGVQRDRRGLG